jgi:hypothetical protein
MINILSLIWKHTTLGFHTFIKLVVGKFYKYKIIQKVLKVPKVLNF